MYSISLPTFHTKTKLFHVCILCSQLIGHGIDQYKHSKKTCYRCKWRAALFLCDVRAWALMKWSIVWFSLPNHSNIYQKYVTIIGRQTLLNWEASTKFKSMWQNNCFQVGKFCRSRTCNCHLWCLFMCHLCEKTSNLCHKTRIKMQKFY